MSPTRIAMAGTLLLIVLAGCSLGGRAASVTPPPDADVAVTASEGRFDKARLDAPAGRPFELFFRNLELAPHNVAIYADEDLSRTLFSGETISDAATVYEVPALEAGTYFFRCDVHPEMTGELVAA
jgi:plastocyanin